MITIPHENRRYTLEEWIRETNGEVISERLKQRWKKRNL